jgi:hypothetical protein
MKSICDGSSKFCASVYSGVSQLLVNGQSQSGAKVHVKIAQAGPITSNRVSLVDGVISQDPGVTLDSAGKTVDELGGHPAKSTKAVVQWVSGSWRVMGMEIVK